MRAAVLSVILWVLGVLLLACRSSPQDDARVVIDDLGEEVRIKRDIKTIVSLVPTNSELVCILDCTRLRAGTRYDRFPEELVKRVKEKEIEILGGGFDPNLEKIVALDPDLILTNGPSQQRVVLPLKRLDYSVLSLYPQDIEQLKRDFLLLGEILEQQATAKRIIGEVETGLTEIRKNSSNKKPKRVYLQTAAAPMITVGRASFAHWLISLAGGTNIFENMPFDSGKASVEWIVQSNPEVLILVGKQEEFVSRTLKLPEWREIDAVKNHHVCFIDAAEIRRTILFLNGVEKISACLWQPAARTA